MQLIHTHEHIFVDLDKRLNSWFSILLHCSIQVKDAEALGFATIFRKALLYHPPSKNLPPNIVSHMLQHMFNLTAHFCEASVRVENVRIHQCYQIAIKHANFIEIRLFFLLFEPLELGELNL